MRRTVRSAVIVLCAAASMTTVLAPAASASPVSDFIDSLDLGSSGPAPSTGATAPFTVTYARPVGADRVYLAGGRYNCLDVDGIPEMPFAAGPSLALTATVATSGRCDGAYGTQQFDIVVVGAGTFAVGTFDLRLGSRGNLFVDCVDAAKPGFASLTCTQTHDSVTFS